MESLSVKSDLVLSNEDVRFAPQSASYLKQNSNFKLTNNGTGQHNSGISDLNIAKSNNCKKQDKLNRLLQELKDYSQDESLDKKMNFNENCEENGKPNKSCQSVKVNNGNEVNVPKPNRGRNTFEVRVTFLCFLVSIILST